MYKIELTGNANDLYYISKDDKIASIKLVDGDPGSNISLEFVSESDNGEHRLLKNFLDKKISIKISVIE